MVRPLRTIDGEARTNALLNAQKVVRVELDEQTADLHIMSEGGVRLDFFNNSAGFEGWRATIGGPQGVTIIALGGGKLAVH